MYPVILQSISSSFVEDLKHDFKKSLVVKGVFLQLRNEFEFPAKTIFSNISTAIGVTAVSYL